VRESCQQGIGQHVGAIFFGRKAVGNVVGNEFGCNASGLGHATAGRKDGGDCNGELTDAPQNLVVFAQVGLFMLHGGFKLLRGEGIVQAGGQEHLAP
jgi:hypothetical protein